MQGIVLTQCDDLSALLSAMRSNRIPLLKVVSGWGFPWDAASRAQVAHLATILVRTQTGDGCAAPGQIVYLDPAIVMRELEPWVVTRGQIMVELGNEPNVGDASDDAAWVWRYWMQECIWQIRARWPAVRIVSAGLHENRQAEWWAICRDVFEQADAVGYHAYGWHDFLPQDTGQIQRAHEQLRNYFPDKPWMATELGINDMGTSAETKAERYSALHSKLPSNVAAACWYHQTDQPSDDDQRAYQLPSSAWPYLQAGGAI